MRYPSRSPRTSIPLSFTLHAKLNAYALGAAAGVTVLASTPPADAEVVFTPVNGVIAQGSKYALDLNHDGSVDFNLINDYHNSTTPFGDDLDISPVANGNGVFQGRRERFNSADAAALQAGISIGTGKPFIFRQVNMAYASLTAFTYVSGGPWKNVTNRFLGLKFLINGEVHFGWARLTVLTDSHRKSVRATITGYAYETLANRPILAGQTSGTATDAALSPPTDSPAWVNLGLLALGSQALAVWREQANLNP